MPSIHYVIYFNLQDNAIKARIITPTLKMNKVSLLEPKWIANIEAESSWFQILAKDFSWYLEGFTYASLIMNYIHKTWFLKNHNGMGAPVKSWEHF